MDVKELTGASEMVVRDRPLVVHGVQEEEIYDAVLVPDERRQTDEMSAEAKAAYERSSYVEVRNDYARMTALKDNWAFFCNENKLGPYATLANEETAQDFLKRKMGDHLARPA